MPMKKAVEINRKIYDARVYVDGCRVYDLTKDAIFVESYQDRPSISPIEFWRDYAYSGEADKWFPHIDPDSITYKPSAGQYDIGTDVYAYGRLLGDHKDLILEIRDALAERRLMAKSNREIDKKITALEKSKVQIPFQLYFDA